MSHLGGGAVTIGETHALTVSGRFETLCCSLHLIVREDRVDELAIEFVFIPPYSPTLNAIEPLWEAIKRETSPTIFETKDYFREFLTEAFLRLSHQLSFAVDWTETFLPDVQKLR
ncbi:hypothetical protein BRC68_18310 [Halobacteriales archaeon QH_6_64_20]|nr:MAG: hypothetical protein BRC68_18310 [Halobacteriales archaeon QH_6_64_20]